MNTYKALFVFLVISTFNAHAADQHCYKTDGGSTLPKDLSEMTLVIEDQIENDNFWTYLGYVSEKDSGSLNFNCISDDKDNGSFSCSAGDDSGEFSYKSSKDGEGVEVKLNYAYFGDSDEEYGFEIKSSDEQKNEILLTFKKSTCK